MKFTRIPMMGKISDGFKSGRWPLFLAVGTLVLVIAYEKLKKDEVPITRCIGLEPAYDEVRDRFNNDTVRNLIYENKSSDPLFYFKLVGRIENCEWVKANRLVKQEPGGISDQFVFSVTNYKEEKLRESVVFVAPDGVFRCHVYNGTDFVLVVLSVWY